MADCRTLLIESMALLSYCASDPLDHQILFGKTHQRLVYKARRWLQAGIDSTY